MLKQTLLCVAFIASGMGTTIADASEARTSDYTHVFVANEVPSDASMPSLLVTISTWLTQNFDLPAMDDPPKVELAAPARIAALRYRGLLPQMHPMPAGDQPLLGAGRAVVAVYDSSRQIIYLPEGWTGETPAEQSVLVHEMVHHLQNRGRLQFNCPEEREKLAYEAQERWLARFGGSLERDFEVDPFTLLVQINCIR